MLRINNNKLLTLRKYIPNDVIIFDNCMLDDHCRPESHLNSDIFVDSIKSSLIFGAKTILLNDCDKHFTYHWLNKIRFPILEKIYVNYPLKNPFRIFLENSLLGYFRWRYILCHDLKM